MLVGVCTAYFPLVLYVLVLVLIYQSGLRTEPIPSGVYSLLRYLCWCFCASGAYPWWGGRKAPRYQGLLGCLLRKVGAAHGPLHPALFSMFFVFCFSRMSRNKFSDWFLVHVCALGKFVCDFELFKLRALSRFFVWDPHWNSLAAFGTQWFLSSCSGTLSSLPFSLSERYRSGLAGTHTRTGGTPFPSCSPSPVAVFCCFFLLCSFASCGCHLVLVCDFRGSVRYPQFSGSLGITCLFWGPLPISRKLLCSWCFFFFVFVFVPCLLLLFLLFLCGGCTTHLERGRPVFVRGIPPGLRTCPPPEWGLRGAVERDRLAPGTGIAL